MYVAGFVLAVKTDRQEDYRKAAATAAEVSKDHGATRVVECWGDDVPEGEVTSFARAVALGPGETVLFSWVEYPDRETYRTGMQAVAQDPRLQQPHDMTIMDPKRLIWGGFTPILEV